MKKHKLFEKAVSLSLTLALIFSSVGMVFAGMSNFKEQNSYSGFGDVASKSWYYPEISKSSKLGLFNGYADGTFKPNGNITIAEVIKVASVVRATYDGETPPSNSNSGAWYGDYVSYAVSKGIIGSGDFSNYNSKAKRSEMAYIFSQALPVSEYPAINAVPKIPDVTTSTEHYGNIFALYEAGILKGSDAYGTFRPDDYITRAEASAIINRVAQAEDRAVFSLEAKPMEFSFEQTGVMTEAEARVYIRDYLNNLPEDKLIGQPLDSLQKQLLEQIKADPKNSFPEFNSVENFEFTRQGSSIVFYTKFVANVLMCGGDINNYDINIW